jgi:lysophospholipase L1-like esterase
MLRSVWLRRLVLATVVPLLLAELVLQLGALAVAAFVSSREHAGSGECALLCVGDSYTYGLGASRGDCSYPSVLETLLRDAHEGGPSRVVNAGWPGRNSRTVIELLPRHLQEFRPRRVAILCGANDVWSRPGRVKIEDLADPPASGGAATRFRFEWRLPRLIALVVRSPKVQEIFLSSGRTAPPAGASPPVDSAAGPASAQLLVGTWSAGASRLELKADGSALFDGAPLRWSFAPKSIEFVGAGATMRVRWRLENDRLDLVVAGEASPREFVRAPAAPAETTPKPDPNAQVWQAIDADDLPKALQIVRTWIADEPESAWAHEMLVNVGKRLAQQEVVDEGLAWLRDRHLRRPDVWVAEALACALWDANLGEEAGRVARADVERWPDNLLLWTKLAQSAENARDFETLEWAVERAIEIGSRDRVYPHADNLRLRARLRLARSDPRGAARDALEAFAVDAFEGELRNALQRVGMHCDPALVDELAPEVGLAGERLASAKRIAGEAGAGDEDAPIEATLVDHLEQIVRYCRSHGAEPILLTYPFHGDALERAQRRAAQETGATLVEVTARFDRLLADHPWDEFFVPDGHCNDLGYRSMAEEVAGVLRRH